MGVPSQETRVSGPQTCQVARITQEPFKNTEAQAQHYCLWFSSPSAGGGRAQLCCANTMSARVRPLSLSDWLELIKKSN